MATAVIGIGLGVLDAVWPKLGPLFKGRGKKRIAMAMAAVQANDSEVSIRRLQAQMSEAVETGQKIDPLVVRGWLDLVDDARMHADRAGDILRGFDDDVDTGDQS